MEIRCRQCNSPIDNSQSRGRKKQFCSRQCYTKFYYRLPGSTTGTTALCDVCGTKFVKNKNNQRYCSPLCYGRAWANNNREKYNSRARVYNKERRTKARAEPIACEGCDLMFVRSHANQRYCTPSCHARHYTKTNRKAVNGYRQKYHNNVRQKTPWMPSLIAAKARAAKRKYPFELTVEWASTVWTGSCALSGLAFDLDTRKSPLTPSIDRINSSEGYTIANSRFVALAVNSFKREFDDAIVIKIAKGIAAKFP